MNRLGRRLGKPTSIQRLARFIDAQAAFDALLDAGVVVRDMRATAGLGDALRISIGTPAQNDRVLAVLADARQAA